MPTDVGDYNHVAADVSERILARFTAVAALSIVREPADERSCKTKICAD